MSGRTAILVVNGFDRAGMLGTHFEVEQAVRYPWIDICLREVRRRSRGSDFEVFVWDNSQLPGLRDLIRGHGARILPSDERLDMAVDAHEPGAPVLAYVMSHAASLQALLLEVGRDFEYVVTLDSDAFPVRDGWLEVLKENLASTSLTGVWRDEMPGPLPPFIHPSGLCIRRERLLRIEHPFAFVGGQAMAHGITTNVLEAGEGIMPLRRSNARDAHFLIGGIYGDLIYHHGAGSRAPVFWLTEGEQREDRVHAALRDAVFQDLDLVMAVLRGERDEDLGLEWNARMPTTPNFVRTEAGTRKVAAAEPEPGSLVVSGDGASWLNELPDGLAEHADVLRRLLEVATRDPRMRALQVQGSVGRGEGDPLSDLDVGIVVAEEAWPDITREFKAVTKGLGDVIDDHESFLPSNESPEIFKVWAHLRSGVQLDLLVIPSSRLLGSGPDGRTLLDRDGILLPTDHPRRLAAPGEIIDWTFLCWQNLTEVIKYLERGKATAAAEWLSSGRQAAISCWAAANGVEYAAFANVAAARLGVSAPWPAGLENAYPTPDAGEVLVAARALAAVQSQTDRLLQLRLGISPRPLAAWVRQKLETVAAVPAPRDSRRGRHTRGER